MLISYNTGIEIEGVKNIDLNFGKRYLPISVRKDVKIKAKLHWEIGKEFEILSIDKEKEEYFISSPEAKYYSNESPIFFIAQIFSRLLEKENFLFFTDSVVIKNEEEGILLLSQPHGGKSSIAGLFLNEGKEVLSNENSVFKVENGKLIFLTGAPYLTISKKSIEKYNLRLNPIGKTKSGYSVIDLSSYATKNEGTEIEKIFILHTSFLGNKCEIEPIEKNRKLMKILWNYSSSVIRGVDFYPPYTVNLSDVNLDKNRAKNLKEISEFYKNSTFELFGCHSEAFTKIRSL